MALAGSLQTTYGQVDAEGVADSTLSAAGGETDSLQIVVQREMNKIPTVVYKGALVDAATGGPVQGGIIQVAGDDRFSSISDEQGAFEIKVPLYANQLINTRMKSWQWEGLKYQATRLIRYGWREGISLLIVIISPIVFLWKMPKSL